jgi:hypothetical protein
VYIGGIIWGWQQGAACGCAIIGGEATTPWQGFHVAHGAGQGAAAATGAAIGVTYCGIGAMAGGQTGAAATGAAYVGGQAAPRLNQLHGQHGHKSPTGQQAAHPPKVAGIAVTASKVSIFFMVSLAPWKAVGNYCLGSAV